MHVREFARLCPPWSESPHETFSHLSFLSICACCWWSLPISSPVCTISHSWIVSWHPAVISVNSHHENNLESPEIPFSRQNEKQNEISFGMGDGKVMKVPRFLRIPHFSLLLLPQAYWQFNLIFERSWDTEEAIFCPFAFSFFKILLLNAFHFVSQCLVYAIYPRCRRSHVINWLYDFFFFGEEKISELKRRGNN